MECSTQRCQTSPRRSGHEVREVQYHSAIKRWVGDAASTLHAVRWRRSAEQAAFAVSVLLLAGGCEEGASETPVDDGSVDRSALRRCAPADGDAVVTDAEAAQLAGCELLEGSIRVGPDLTDLSPFASLVVIEGGLATTLVDFPEPLSFEHFGKLREIDGGLLIVNRPVPSLQGLSSLDSVGGLAVSRTTQLSSLAGLERLESIGGVVIFANAELSGLSRLEGLREVRETLEISENPVLPQADAEAFAASVEVGGATVVGENGGGL